MKEADIDTRKTVNPSPERKVEKVEEILTESQKKLKRDIELGESRQKQMLNERAKSPDAVVDMIAGASARESMARRLVPEAFIHEKKRFDPGQTRRPNVDFKPGSTMEVGYDEPTDLAHNKRLASGWIPVIDEHGNHATEPGGDRLYKRDIAFLRDKNRFASRLSNEQLKSVGNMVKDHAPFDGDVSFDETLVSKEKK